MSFYRWKENRKHFDMTSVCLNYWIIIFKITSLLHSVSEINSSHLSVNNYTPLLVQSLPSLLLSDWLTTALPIAGFWHLRCWCSFSLALNSFAFSHSSSEIIRLRSVHCEIKKWKRNNVWLSLYMSSGLLGDWLILLQAETLSSVQM